MKIKILNKNNNSVYEVDEAPVFTECYNETLDTGSIVISNRTSIIEMSPYDIVEIQYDSGIFWKYMCIDTYTETLTCVNPKIYRYEISLFSETKQLEGTVLPNLKITKVWGETRSIYEYIEQYMNEYCPKIRVDTNPISYVNKFSLSDRLSAKFSDECPEMQWNTPTLRELLNDLMMVKDCIPIIKNGELDFIDLTEVKNKDWSDDVGHINYVSKSKSSEDYVSELQVDLQNITNRLETVNNIVTKSEWVMFSPTDEGVVLQNDNMVLKTAYPIYKLKSLTIHFEGAYVVGVDATNTWFTQDISDMVYEYQEWITKPVLYNVDAPSFENFKNSQNWSLYYTRNTNEIRNWNHKTKFWWQDKFLYDELTDRIIRYQHPNVNVGSSVTKPQWYTIFFKIEYETLAGCLFRASKNNDVEHERVVIDNQTNSMVDSYAQGFLEYQKANRLGNEQLQINARFEGSDFNYLILGGVQYNRDESKDHFSNHNYYGWTDKNGNTIYSLRTSPTIYNSLYRKVGGNYVNAGSPSRIVQIPLINIAETYEDSIIYQVQYQMFKNHIEVNALATKNYVLREYFTGVKSKIRSWQIADESQSCKRHDLTKYYCELSYNLRVDINLSNFDDYDIAKYLIPYNVAGFSPIRYVFVQTRALDTDDSNVWYPLSSRYYCLDLISRLVGNSLVFSYEFYDNFWACQMLDTDVIDEYTDFTVAGEIVSGLIENKGFPLKMRQYTNNIGEYNKIFAIYSENIINSPYSGDWVDGEDVRDYPNKAKDYVYNLWQMPEVGNAHISNPRFTSSVEIHKDSQERIAVSTQFEFCTENSNILFSNYFLRNQKAVSTNSNNVLRKAKFYNKSDYDFRNPNKYPSATAEEEINVANVRITNADAHGYNACVEIGLSESYDTAAEAKARAEELAEDYCLYIGSENDVALAFNNIPEDNCSSISTSSDPWRDNYDQLAFIQNNGTQYIDLGFVPNTNNRWSYQLEYTDVSGSGSNYVMGSRVGTGTIYFGVTGASATRAITVCNTDLTLSNFRLANKSYVVNASYEGTTDGRAEIIDGSTALIYQGTQNVSLSGSSANVCVFALQASNIHSGMKVHSLLIKKDNDIFMNLVPVKEKTGSQRLGLYDIENDVFYPNAGSGTFIAGPSLDTLHYYPAVKFYLNVLKSRNKNIYDSDNPYLIIDEI